MMTRLQRRMFGRGPGVAPDQVQVRDRHVQLVALGIFDREEFAALATDIERHQAEVAADAMIFVHHRGTDREFAEIADDGFRIAPGAFSTPHLLHALAVQLAFGQHRERWIGQREAVRQ